MKYLKTYKLFENLEEISHGSSNYEVKMDYDEAEEIANYMKDKGLQNEKINLIVDVNEYNNPILNYSTTYKDGIKNKKSKFKYHTFIQIRKINTDISSKYGNLPKGIKGYSYSIVVDSLKQENRFSLRSNNYFIPEDKKWETLDECIEKTKIFICVYGSLDNEDFQLWLMTNMPNKINIIKKYISDDFKKKYDYLFDATELGLL